MLERLVSHDTSASGATRMPRNSMLVSGEGAWGIEGVGGAGEEGAEAAGIEATGVAGTGTFAAAGPRGVARATARLAAATGAAPFAIATGAFCSPRTGPPKTSRSFVGVGTDAVGAGAGAWDTLSAGILSGTRNGTGARSALCLLYTSDAADE